MRLVVLSDTHGLHDRIESLPEGDILVHAGDFMNSGYEVQEILSFNRWLGEHPFKHRVVCGGNHDRYFEAAPEQVMALLTNAHYLENTGVSIDNVTFWGSPYTPEFLHWAFMYSRGTSTQRYWNLVPYNLDVLITHGPQAKLILDARNYLMRLKRRSLGFICSAISMGVLEHSITEPPDL